MPVSLGRVPEVPIGNERSFLEFSDEMEEAAALSGVSEAQFRQIIWTSHRQIRASQERMASAVEDIVIQTKITNGRVSKLEQWRIFLAGGMTVLAAIVVPVAAGVAIWVITT